MSDMPKEIFAYHKEHGTGTWIDFDDSSKNDRATQYTRTDTIQAMQDKIDEQQRLLEPFIKFAKSIETAERVNFGKKLPDEKTVCACDGDLNPARLAVGDFKALTQAQKER